MKIRDPFSVIAVRTFASSSWSSDTNSCYKFRRADRNDQALRCPPQSSVMRRQRRRRTKASRIGTIALAGGQISTLLIPLATKDIVSVCRLPTPRKIGPGHTSLSRSFACGFVRRSRDGSPRSWQAENSLRALALWEGALDCSGAGILQCLCFPFPSKICQLERHHWGRLASWCYSLR